MARRVVLHVGAMKSGTSYVQAQLFANKAVLAEQDVLVPGRTWGRQVAAVLDVLGRGEGRRDVPGAWQALVDEVERWPGTAVVSMEFLGPVALERIEGIVGHFADAEVQVVLTARDLNRSIAAMWQETVQNGRWWTWPEYVHGVEQGRPRPERTPEDVTVASRTFWRQQNIVRMSRLWQKGVGADRYTLVTVPAPGAPPELLMERVGSVVGFDAAPLRPGPRVNASVGAASAEVLRRMNAVLAERDLEFPAGDRYRKHTLAKGVLAGRAREEPKIGLPVADWVAPHARRMVEQLQELDVRLVGEWSDLEPVPVSGIDPSTLSLEDCRAAAHAGLIGLHERVDRHFPGQLSGPAPDEAELAGLSVERVVERIADLVQQAVALESRDG